VETVAWVLCTLLIVQIVFQAMLASGARLGHIAYGGKHKGTLPNKLRLISAVAVVFYVFFFSVALTYATEMVIYPQRLNGVVLWVMSVFFGLGILANAASPSKPERWWALYALAAFVCTVALLT